jgi:hypothetical protein
MNIFNKGKIKNQINISGNGIITGNNINIKNSSIISNGSNVQMVSTNFSEESPTSVSGGRNRYFITKNIVFL